MHLLLNNAAGFLFSQSLQISVVFFLALIACRLLRNASAHWRYLLWLVVVAKCLTPPIVALPLAVLPVETNKIPSPSIAIEAEPKIQLKAIAATPMVEQPTALESQRRPELTALQVATPPALGQWTRFKGSQLMVIVWLIGVGGLLSIVGGRMWATQRRVIRNRVPGAKELQTAIAALAGSLGLKKVPHVYEVDFTAQPFVWGWLRGDIYLPSRFSETVSAEKRLAMLTHELAHVLRWDAGINHLQNIVQALFFFHPLIWFVNRRLRLEREKCCDEIVLSSSSTSPKVYCEAIVDMLTRECTSKIATPTLAVTGSTKNIKERIVSMLTPNRTFLRRPSRTTVIMLLLFAACVLPTTLVVTSRKGVGQSEQETKFPVEMKPFKWRLVDEAGCPVKDVHVTAAGLRCKEVPTSGCGWPTNNASKTESLTDENGEIDIEYPVRFGMPGHWLTTSKLIFRFKHSDYVAGEAEVDPTLSDATHTVVKGCPAVFRCTDAEGVALKEFAVLMAGKGGDAIWKLNSGEARSNGVPEGTWQTMLVVPSNDGRHQFSEIFVVNCAKGKCSISEVEVQPGMRRTGRLSDNVPRPIEDGKVIAWCVPKPSSPSLVAPSSVTWLQETTISADGTFEFPSLPSSQSVQLIALCEGWLIEGWSESTMKGMEITIDEKQIAENRVSEITLQMEQAGSLEVEVLDPDGKPLVGAEVSTWPNQSYSHNSGATLLGFCYNSINLVKAQIAGTALPVANWNEPGRYVQRTDGQGKALLRDIPLGQPLGLYVFYENLTAKPDKSTYNTLADAIAYQCDSPKLKTMTVQMYRTKGSSSDNSYKKEIRDDLEKSLTDAQLQSTMNKQDSRFDVELLNSEELHKVCQDRALSVDSQVRQAILDYADSLETTPPAIQPTIQLLRDGTDTLSLHALTQILQDRENSAQPIARALAAHDDPTVRFVASLTIAVLSGDTNSAQSIHTLIHDTSLSQADMQIICTWSNGVGIRPTDSPMQISEHFANVTSQDPKFKTGDVAPDFEFETVAGLKFASKDLLGKVIVLHFWATSCAPCMGQMESHIASLAKHDQSKLEVVFISLDDEKEKFIAAVKKYRIPFKNVRDERGWGGELARLFGVRSLPLDITIDSDGRIVSNSIDDVGKLLKTTR